MSHKVAVIVGSLRKASHTRKVARALEQLAPPALSFEHIDIGELAHYNEDLELPAPPPAWQRFRDQVRACDAVLWATPEYNRSVPGVMKNAIDVGSCPAGKSVWAGKPCAVVSVSPGSLGGFGANHHLRQSFAFLDMPCMQQPEAYVAGVSRLIDAEGKVIHPATRDFLTRFVTAFAAWIAQHARTS
jgi:chromate reductase